MEKGFLNDKCYDLNYLYQPARTGSNFHCLLDAWSTQEREERSQQVHSQLMEK